MGGGASEPETSDSPPLSNHGGERDLGAQSHGESLSSTGSSAALHPATRTLPCGPVAECRIVRNDASSPGSTPPVTLSKALMGGVLALGAALLLVAPTGTTTTGPRVEAAAIVGGGEAAGPTTRALPSRLYGVTVDDIANLSDIVASARALGHMPVTRVYFNVKEPASYYAAAVRAIQPVSYVMGELLDSSDARHIGTRAYGKRVESYLAQLGNSVDVWEIGNEVNGNWTGRYSTVEAKLTAAYDDVTAAGRRSALTLYYNVGCGDGSRELDPVTFSERFVPSAVRSGLDYVLLSYYEGDCKGIRPSAATWTAYFARLHGIFPHALVGFGEIGMDDPATSNTLGTARSLMTYYYGLGIDLPYYVGGYFWWYYDEDCLPYAIKPLWATLQSAFMSEAAALSH
jgi:hypothetical protein